MIQHLESSLIEKDVENAWRSKINSLFPDSTMTSPYNTDGYLESEDGKISLLLEFKFQENLKSKLAQVNILSQTLYYIKKFEKEGRKLPKVILIADKNECFILHSNPLSKYLDYKLNWNAAASTAFKANPELISDMLEDPNINPFVFDIVTGFNFLAIKNKVVELSENVTRLVKVTEHNINNVFEYFQKNVLGKNALSVNEVANLFVNLIINPGENYLHPKRKNILITKSFGDVYVNTDKYVSFFSHFDGEQYSIRDKEKLTSIVDRIVEDETRRRKGEFFTPTIWVDEAHKMIAESFGENWKEEYVVWDPACGTLNLTRDYKFKELYCSTIEESDIKTADQMKYNPEAVKFQYDFLNDGIVGGKIDIENDPKLPEGLKLALLEGKKIIVLMNPPYGTARSDKNVSEGKSGISKNNLNDIMIQNKFGEASKNLYSQFLFKCFQLSTNINICLFSPNLFLTSKSFKNFNSYIKSKVNICGGFMLDARNFDGTSIWPITFTILSKNLEYSNVFKVKDLNRENFHVDYLFDKILEMIDEERACDWIKTSSNKDKISPNFSSAIGTKNTTNRSNDKMLCVLNNGGNRIEKNEKECSFLSGPYSGNTGVIVETENFLKCNALFTSRKSIKQTWFNMKDEYHVPKME